MNTQDVGQVPLRQTVTVREMARLLGIGKATAYEAVKSGKIPSLRLGRRIVIPKAALEKLLSRSAEGESSGD